MTEVQMIRSLLEVINQSTLTVQGAAVQQVAALLNLAQQMVNAHERPSASSDDGVSGGDAEPS